MGFIDDFLSQPNAQEQESKIKVVVDGDHGHIEFPPEAKIPAGETELLEAVGLDPKEWELVGNQGLTDHRDDQGNRIQVWFKPKFRRRGLGIDWDKVAEGIGGPLVLPGREPLTKEWFHVQFGDIHIGKSALAGGGAEQIIQKYLESLAKAHRNFIQLGGRSIFAGVCLSFVGDLVEGYVSQGGRNIAQTDINLAKQATAAGKMMHRAIDTFVSEGVPVKVAVIGGNHDEVTRVQSTDPGDNYATMVATFLQMKYDDNERYSMVEVLVPPEGQGHMTIMIGDTPITYVHGHKFGGGNVEKKIQDWWSGQALHGRPAGTSQVLCCGHFHSFRHLQLSSERTAVMSPSMEVESTWFAEQTGARSKRGAVTYTTEAGDVQNVSVI